MVEGSQAWWGAGKMMKLGWIIFCGGVCTAIGETSGARGSGRLGLDKFYSAINGSKGKIISIDDQMGGLNRPSSLGPHQILASGMTGYRFSKPRWLQFFAISFLIFFLLQVTRHLSPYEQQIILPWLKTWPKRVRCCEWGDVKSYRFWLYHTNQNIHLVRAGVRQIRGLGSLLGFNFYHSLWSCCSVGRRWRCPGSFLQVLKN